MTLLSEDLLEALSSQPLASTERIIAGTTKRFLVSNRRQPTLEEWKAALATLRASVQKKSASPDTEPDGDADDKVATRWTRQALKETCEGQYEQDLQVCRALRYEPCYKQASERYAACLSGNPIPPFPY